MASILRRNYFLDGESMFCWEISNPSAPWGTEPGDQLGRSKVLVHSHFFFHARGRTHLTRLPGRPLSYLKPWLICLELRSFWLQHLPGCLEQSMLSWQLLLEGAGINRKLPGLEDSRSPCQRLQGSGNDCWSICRAWVLVLQWDLGTVWRYRNFTAWWGMLYLIPPC